MSTPTSKNATESPGSLPANDSSPPSSDSSSLTPPSQISLPTIPPPPPPTLIESPPLNAPSTKSSTSPPPPSNSVDNGKVPSFPLPPPPPNKSPSSRTPSPPSSQQLSPPAPVNSEKAQADESPSNSNRGGTSSSHLNVPLIAGIAGGILALFIIMGIVSFVHNKKKKRKPHNPMQYYMDPSARKGHDYYVGGKPPKWGNPDRMAASPQGLHVPPNGGWHAPPPPMMNTDDMSTFSGPHAPPMPPPSPTIALGFNKSTFTYEELAAATNGFTQANLLGQGGFGYVHKGVLPNGKEIAVKSLKSGSGQGEREFQAEVDIISRVHHRHLVTLVGYSISGTQRMLVYDFVENKTLEYHLHGKGLPTMEWSTRLKIALGSAKGLAYLHEDCHPRIIHRDIKSANILLDFKFEALVADFGLAKLTSDNHTHVSTRVMGTFGYLAPEYASSGKLTEKSDVFSYGVMLLELITGRRPCDSSHTFMEDSLVDWARPLLSHALSDGSYDELVDPKLEGNYDPMEMARMVASAAATVRHSARRRPKMSQIVRALEGDVSLEDLNEGMRPGQSMLFSSGSDYDSDRYQSNKRRNMRKAPMASPEYSGEYSGPMVNYGHHRAGSPSSDGMFSDEMNPIGNQRLRAHSPI